MNNVYKKGFIEAIDGVLGILKNSVRELEGDDESFMYELKKIENEVLELKISFFENYLESKMDNIIEKSENDPIVISKECISKYCEENGITLEEYKEKIKKSLNDFPPIIMTEEEFDRQSLKNKNNKVYAIVLYDNSSFSIHKIFKTHALAFEYMIKNNFNNDQLLELDVLENLDE